MLLAPTKITFCSHVSDFFVFSAALARYSSGREQALKLLKTLVSREPSSSSHLSLGNPKKVTGRELDEQTLMVCLGFCSEVS